MQFHTDLMKQNQMAKQRGQELKKSNFKFSEKSKADDGLDSYKSMAQVIFDEKTVSGDSSANQVSNNMMKELRSSHFQFGNTDGTKQSCSHGDHTKFNIDTKGMEESSKLAKKMQSAHFMLGDEHNRIMQSSSVYKDSISNNGYNNTGKREKVDVDSRKVNIDIGKGRGTDYTSEAKEKFGQHLGAGNGIDKDTKNNLAYLKQNHFAIGSGKSDYSTVNKTDFGTKANPGYVKHHGNVQKTSFVMGFQGNPFNASTPSGGQSNTERGKTVGYKREVGNSAKPVGQTKSTTMQKENFTLGQNGGEFRTMNQAYYRWIQPKGDRN